MYKDAIEANSPVVRENCWEWYTSVVKTRMHNFSGELIVFTRWHEEDLIGTLCRREPFVEFTDWAQLDTLPPDTWLYLNFEALKTRPPSPVDPREPGEALWEELHGAELLRGKRRLDPVRFECMYQGRPSVREGLLYGDNFLTYEELPRDIVRRANYTDTADTGDDYLCSLCYVVDPDGVIYVTDAVYSREPMEMTEGLVGTMLRESGTRAALIESNNGGRGFARAVQALAPQVRVEWFHQSANKEARILSNAATVVHTVRFPCDWALRWPELYAHLTTYRWKFRFCVSIPHIYSSVGYGSSFILLWVCHNLLINKRNRLHAFFFVNRLIGACQQEIRLYDRRSLEVSKLRKFRANRWHDAADVVTGLVEREIAGRDTRIKSVKFM
ncbi:phage terminase large subunit [Alistipes putredinis]|uniref:phage terminase large subunit n=1 Tax=Alistipes putredinis TaxID=28117 RepID=UPI000338C115|nr:phage terminase large subunit [Alistipes putredinis]CDE63235.1 phage uncharacterized protein domain protein [Alistipes putredinis CAG:67]